MDVLQPLDNIIHITACIVQWQCFSHGDLSEKISVVGLLHSQITMIHILCVKIKFYHICMHRHKTQYFHFVVYPPYTCMYKFVSFNCAVQPIMKRSAKDVIGLIGCHQSVKRQHASKKRVFLYDDVVLSASFLWSTWL